VIPQLVCENMAEKGKANFFLVKMSKREIIPNPVL
jgi:hypothetical protein